MNLHAVESIYHDVTSSWLVSLGFIYVFLPLSLFIYYIVLPKRKTEVLLALSLLYCFLVRPYSIFVMIGSVALEFAIIKALEAVKHKKIRTGLMLASLIKNIAVCAACFFSYKSGGALPVWGVIVYSFSCIECTANVYKNTAEKKIKLLPFALYCLFFPRLYAGPLLSSQKFFKRLEQGDEIDKQLICKSFSGYAQGTLKIVVFGTSLFELNRHIYESSQIHSSVVTSWMLTSTLALSVYFALSGLCDTAQGLGGLFGLELPQNFYYPYQSRSVTDFFERFNMTVTGFLKNMKNLFIPNCTKTEIKVLLTLLTGVVMGFWLDISLNGAIWGIFIAMFIVMEKYVYPQVLSSVPILLSRIFTLCVVLVSFLFLSSQSMSEAMRHISIMFLQQGQKIDFINPTMIYLLTSNWLLLLLSVFFATNISGLAVGNFRKSLPKASYGVMWAVNGLILIGVTAWKIL